LQEGFLLQSAKQVDDEEWDASCALQYPVQFRAHLHAQRIHTDCLNRSCREWTKKMMLPKLPDQRGKSGMGSVLPTRAASEHPSDRLVPEGVDQHRQNGEGASVKPLQVIDDNQHRARCCFTLDRRLEDLSDPIGDVLPRQDGLQLFVGDERWSCRQCCLGYGTERGSGGIHVRGCHQCAHGTVVCQVEQIAQEASLPHAGISRKEEEARSAGRGVREDLLEECSQWISASHRHQEARRSRPSESITVVAGALHRGHTQIVVDSVFQYASTAGELEVGYVDGMPRVRTFDTERLAADAVNLFWERGYGGVSLHDIAAATGIGNGSIYLAFGNKHRLFLEALALYCARRVALVHEAVSLRSGGAEERLFALFEVIISDCLSDPAKRGCFLINSFAERGMDAEVVALTTRTMTAMECEVAVALRGTGARARPERITDAATHAIVLSQSLIQLSRLGRAEEELRRFARTSAHAIAGELEAA